MGCRIELVEPSQRIAIAGNDWKAWLHNFCSNDIKSLKPGGGCEVFILNVKGRTICHAIVLCLESSAELLVTGIPAVSLMEHFDRYIIREDVKLSDKSADSSLWWASGRGNEPVEEVSPDWSHREVLPGVRMIQSRIGDSPDRLFSVERASRSEFDNWRNDHGLDHSTGESFLAARIRGRWPMNQVDLSDANFPQEFDRDSQAISFRKGCYLGQETVARIDALGHVNQILVSLNLAGEGRVEAGTKLFVDDLPGKPAGHLTSVAKIGVNEWIALGFVRRNLLDQIPNPRLHLDGEINVAVQISRAASS